MSVPTDDSLREKWNTFAATFESELEKYTVPLSSTLISLADPYSLKEGQLVVEAGCGGGGASLLCAQILSSKQQGGKLKCYDLSPNMIALTQQKLSIFPDTASAEVASAENLPQDDCSVDRYYANLTLQLVCDPDKMIQDVYRVLKPGGRAAFSIWGKKENSPMMTIPPRVIGQFGGGSEPERSPFHLGGQSEELRKRFMDVGFKSCQIWTQNMICAITSGEQFAALQLSLPFVQKTVSQFSDEQQQQVREGLAAEAQKVIDSGKPICLETEIIFVTK